MRIRLTKLRLALLAFVALILIIRAILPSLILKKLNAYLADFSPVYAIHIRDLDLGFLTFSYEFQDLTAHYKKTNQKFFDVKSIRVQLSFTELLHLRILTNVDVEEGKFVLTKTLFNGSKTEEAKPKEAAKDASNKLFPIRIAVVELHKCASDFADFMKQDQKTRWRVSDIEAKVFNLNPLPENPYTTFSVGGELLGSAPFKIAGRAKRMAKPIAWKFDLEMKDFTLADSNPILLYYLPFTFTKGKLDLYSEVKSEEGSISGYVKPFLKNAEILSSKESFKSVKHFFFEIAGAFANFMLKNADNKTTATKIAFHQEKGEFKVDVGGALSKAIKNGYDKPLAPGTDDTVPFK